MAEEKKMGLTPEEQGKTILVEFLGGFRDGQVLRSDSSNRDEFQECLALYILHSQGGQLGKRFKCYSEAGIAELGELLEVTPEGPRLKREPMAGRNHIYEVVSRQEDDDTIRIRYQYMGQD